MGRPFWFRGNLNNNVLPTLLIHALTRNQCWKCFWAFQAGKRVFNEESSSRNTGKYCYTYIFFIVFKIMEWFQKGTRLQRFVDLYNGESCLIFNFWASRALIYSGRNLLIVDFSSVDLRSWNWRGDGEAMNFMVILQSGLNFTIQVSLWAHITSIGCRRQTVLLYDRLVMLYYGIGYVMI